MPFHTEAVCYNKMEGHFRHRRGRDAGYPTPPAQIPACGFPAPGSSVVLASAVLIALDIAILLREVGLCAPVRHVRHKFPVRTAYHRQPLPRVVGSPALKVLWVDPTPWRPSAPLLGVTYLSETGAVRVSQVPDASLHAYHALKWTPADPREAHQTAPSVLASGALTPSPSAFSFLTGLYQALGSAVSPAVYVVPCVRFTCVVRLSTSFTDATLGTGGWLDLTR